jgi:hypothetical protein
MDEGIRGLRAVLREMTHRGREREHTAIMSRHEGCRAVALPVELLTSGTSLVVYVFIRPRAKYLLI